MTLTARTVEALEPEEKAYTAWNDKLTGFGVRVQPTGLRSYLVNYRAGDRGRTAAYRRIVIARHGPIAADQPCRHAREILRRVAQGEDPASHRVRRRAIREPDSPHCRAHDSRRSIASHALSLARNLPAKNELPGTAVSAPGLRASLPPRPIRPCSLDEIIHPRSPCSGFTLCRSTQIGMLIRFVLRRQTSCSGRSRSPPAIL